MIQYREELELFKQQDGTYIIFKFFDNTNRHYIFKIVHPSMLRLELETLLKRLSEKWIQETTVQEEAQKMYHEQNDNNQSKVSYYIN